MHYQNLLTMLSYAINTTVGVIMFKISHVQKKQISGLTGLALVGFVIAHLSGNFLIFKRLIL